MEVHQIEGTGLEVSRVALGTWAMGGWLWGGTDEQQAIRTIHTALDHGITLIDTAPIYGFGVSETIVGKALATSTHRSRAIVATKLGLEWLDDRVRRNASRPRVVQEVEDSLRRLGVDHVDIEQVHWPDPNVPAQETAEALARLLEQGKIRAVGVSNYSPAQMTEFARFAPLHTSQPPYNLFEREVELDVLPHCRGHQITTLMYGALCRGLLSGRIGAETKFAGGDIRGVDPKFSPKRLPQYLAALAELESLAQDLGKSLVQLAVRWVLDQPGSHVALWGARRPDQLDPLDGVPGWHLTKDQLRRIDEVVARHVTDPVGPAFMAPPMPKEKS
jgi:aryl-alcohol dehydrogenase-like predicted oxidoreductase